MNFDLYLLSVIYNYDYCRFLQVAGIQFGFDPNQHPGCRVIAGSIRIQGHSLDRDKKYLVAMKEYLTKVPKIKVRSGVFLPSLQIQNTLKPMFLLSVHNKAV